MSSSLSRAAVALCLVLVAACSSSGPSTDAAKPTSVRSPSPSPTVTERPVEGRNIALRDFPDGWADLPYEGHIGRHLAECAELSDTFRRTRSPLLLTGGQVERREAVSEVARLRNPAAAADDLLRITRARSCVQELALVDAANGLTQSPVRVTVLPAAVVGAQAVGFRMNVVTTGQGLAIPEEIQLVVLWAEDRLALLYTFTQNGAFDPALHAHLLRTLRTRINSRPT